MQSVGLVIITRQYQDAVNTVMTILLGKYFLETERKVSTEIGIKT